MIIGNDSELRKYIPNVLTTVEGESSLYEKMLPYLEVATDWLCRNVIATEYPAFQRVKGTMVQKCIVAEAFRLAVPSLDVVLTPNGFGIVSTDRIAPASKERIERLQSRLELYRDELIINIITQLQLNYLDWESKLTESRKNYEICEKFGKDVIVMEPIKGGTLYNLPDDIKEKFEKEGMTLVEAALRFAGSHENVKVVLSGVGNLEQMKENCEVFKPFEPMSEEEEKFVLEMANEIKELNAIDCSYCGYCLKECPAGIPIPDFFELYNSEKMYSLPSLHAIYGTTAAANAPASACTECESCLAICTQKLDIPTLLKDVVNTFE